MISKFAPSKFDRHGMLLVRVAVGQLADAYAQPNPGTLDLGFLEDGEQVRRSLTACWGVRFERAVPVRPFR
ncbi:hypothetical protein ACIGW8_20065 [Streptomyces sioyaensis]|uniref:hypothetical protein n=1 Tax=Streptomyces sioyaensis TaxID=67364 RepID=UPI0037D0FD8E